MNAINAHFRTQYGLPLDAFDHEINVDIFAGGGGASTGIEMGLERPVHLAINHNPAAISMHEANHPGCLHLQTDVWEVDPVEVLKGRNIGWFHASPDCTHHSQAAGGQPRKKEIRNLTWVVNKWAGIGKPRVISLENVKQIRQWGPLIAKRCKKTGRVVTLDIIECPETGKKSSRIAEPGERVPRNNQHLVPDPKRRGQTWNRFINTLEELGYTVEHRLLKACDYGAPTSRERLFLIARCDGQLIKWPEPTHAAKPSKGKKGHRSAAECIDWAIPGKSIFGRKKPLAEATMRRIAKGIKREVLDKNEPFIVPIANWSQENIHPIDKPLNTITAWPKGGAFSIVTPVLTPFYGGEKKGNRAHSIEEPLRTQTTENRFGLATAFLAQANGGFNTTHSKPMGEPVTTITNTGSQQQLVTANLLHLRGNCDSREVDQPLHTISAGGQHHGLVTAFLSRQFGSSVGQSIDIPAPTITAGGQGKSALVELKLSKDHEAGALQCAAFLIRYYGEGGQLGDLREPVHTLTTKDRLALVTVFIKGTPYVIVDIQMRMLQPHELYAAQGFPSNYIITHGHDGRKFTKTQQVFMCGNSVCPPPMAAIARTNNPYKLTAKALAA